MPVCHAAQPVRDLVPRLAVIGIGLALSGCSPGGADRLDNVHVGSVDSAGVSIIVSNASAARAPLGWTVDSVPDLVIGRGGTPATTLHRVQGVLGLPASRVVVVDGGSREVRLFGTGGEVLRVTGGDGAGPGEFRDPVLVPWPGNDSILVFDTRLQRFQMLSPDGVYRRTIVLDQKWPAGRLPPLGAVGQHALLVERRSILGGELALQEFGLRQLVREYFLYDPETARQIAIDTFVVDWSYRTRRDESPVPFSSRPMAAVTADGVLISSGRSYQIEDYGVDGELRRVLRIAMKGEAVTPEMVVELGLDEALENALPIPDTLPRFQDVVVDSQEWIWARLYSRDAAAPGKWIVFDPDGVARGSVTTPAGGHVQIIGSDLVLGSWTDDLGVEYVHRYALERH
jgi:hypothetical protein